MWKASLELEEGENCMGVEEITCLVQACFRVSEEDANLLLGFCFYCLFHVLWRRVLQISG